MQANETIKFKSEVQFTLKCGACAENHQFMSHEVERIVYTMSAMINDLRDTIQHGADGSEPEGEPCLQEILELWSSDSEMYAEHVTAMIEARERVQEESE